MSEHNRIKVRSSYRVLGVSQTGCFCHLKLLFSLWLLIFVLLTFEIKKIIANECWFINEKLKNQFSHISRYLFWLYLCWSLKRIYKYKYIKMKILDKQQCYLILSERIVCGLVSVLASNALHCGLEPITLWARTYNTVG